MLDPVRRRRAAADRKVAPPFTRRPRLAPAAAALQRRRVSRLLLRFRAPGTQLLLLPARPDASIDRGGWVKPPGTPAAAVRTLGCPVARWQAARMDCRGECLRCTDAR